MIVVLKNNEKIHLPDSRCEIGAWTSSIREHSNQIGITSELSITQHSNILAVLAEGCDNRFLITGAKMIPLRSILYLEEETRWQ